MPKFGCHCDLEDGMEPDHVRRSRDLLEAYGVKTGPYGDRGHPMTPFLVHAFEEVEASAILAERKRCALIADGQAIGSGVDTEYNMGWGNSAKAIATSIRRGYTK